MPREFTPQPNAPIVREGGYASASEVGYRNQFDQIEPNHLLGRWAGGRTGPIQWVTLGASLSLSSAGVLEAGGTWFNQPLLTTSSPTFAGMTLTGPLRVPIIRADLASSVNDWSPTGLASASVVLVQPDGAYSITGLASQPDGTLVTLINNSGNALTLPYEDTASEPQNRFALMALSSVVIGTLEAVTLVYSTSFGRWINMSRMA